MSTNPHPFPIRSHAVCGICDEEIPMQPGIGDIERCPHCGAENNDENAKLAADRLKQTGPIFGYCQNCGESWPEKEGQPNVIHKCSLASGSKIADRKMDGVIRGEGFFEGGDAR